MSYTISKQDFDSLTNAYCELLTIKDKLNGLTEILNSKLISNLAESYDAAVKKLSSSIESLQVQDEAAYDAKQEFYTDIAESNNLCSIWSIYEVDPKDFNTVPYPDATVLEYTNNWGSDVRLEVAVPGHELTWLELYKLADRAIRLSGDQHHVFIESIEPKPEDPTVLVLSTGS